MFPRNNYGVILNRAQAIVSNTITIAIENYSSTKKCQYSSQVPLFGRRLREQRNTKNTFIDALASGTVLNGRYLLNDACHCCSKNTYTMPI